MGLQQTDHNTLPVVLRAITRFQVKKQETMTGTLKKNPHKSKKEISFTSLTLHLKAYPRAAAHTISTREQTKPAHTHQRVVSFSKAHGLSQDQRLPGLLQQVFPLSDDSSVVLVGHCIRVVWPVTEHLMYR